jgi:hypothetical protein
MGKHRPSQNNDPKRTAQQQSGKQQRADSDKASSRPAAPNPQQQQNQDTGRSQLGSGDGAMPRAGSNRGADNPSLSANQEDRRGQEASRYSVESLEGEQDGGNENSRKRYKLLWKVSPLNAPVARFAKRRAAIVVPPVEVFAR